MNKIYKLLLILFILRIFCYPALAEEEKSVSDSGALLTEENIASSPGKDRNFLLDENSAPKNLQKIIEEEQKRSVELTNRYEKLLERNERQAERYERILDKWEEEQEAMDEIIKYWQSEIPPEETTKAKSSVKPPERPEAIIEDLE
jgi:hypothetical protein